MDARLFSVRLRFVTLRSQDLERAARFYKGLLGLTSTRAEDDFVQFWAGGVDLCIDLVDGEQPPPPLIFSVDRLEALTNELRSSSHPWQGPIQGRERRYVMVHDPDDHLLVFEEEP